jgi:hypothetical protein
LASSAAAAAPTSGADCVHWWTHVWFAEGTGGLKDDEQLATRRYWDVAPKPADPFAFIGLQCHVSAEEAGTESGKYLAPFLPPPGTH